MPIRFACSRCKASIDAPDKPGWKFRCPGCKELVVVPNVQPAKSVEDFAVEVLWGDIPSLESVFTESLTGEVQQPVPQLDQEKTGFQRRTCDRAHSPIIISVSARLITLPDMCASCCGPKNTTLLASYARTTGVKVTNEKVYTWQFPYCFGCLMETPKAVEYLGFQGSVHTFSFLNPKYASAFRQRNATKIVG